jgi:hypothetical protein
MLEEVEKKATVIDAGKLVFEYEASGISAHILEKIEQFFVFHTGPPSLVTGS